MKIKCNHCGRVFDADKTPVKFRIVCPNFYDGKCRNDYIDLRNKNAKNFSILSE